MCLGLVSNVQAARYSLARAYNNERVHQLLERMSAAATALHLVSNSQAPFCNVTGVRADY